MTTTSRTIVTARARASFDRAKSHAALAQEECIPWPDRSMSQIRISVVTKQSDLDEIHTLYRAVFPDEDPEAVGPRSFADDSYFRNKISRLRGKRVPPVSSYVAAFVDGRLVGAISSEMDVPTIARLATGELAHAQPDVLISCLVDQSRVLCRIAVAPSYREAGVAGRLLTAIEELDRRNGVIRWCGVAVSEPAVKLLRRHGYEVHILKSTDGLPLQLPWTDYAVPVDNALGGKGFHKHLGLPAPARINPLTGRPI